MPRNKGEVADIAHDEAVDATKAQFEEINSTEANLQTSLNSANEQMTALESENTNLKSRVDTLEQHDREVRSKLSL